MKKLLSLVLMLVVGVYFGVLSGVAVAGEHGGKEHGGSKATSEHGGGSHSEHGGAKKAASSDKATILEAAAALAESNPGLSAKLRKIAAKH